MTARRLAGRVVAILAVIAAGPAVHAAETSATAQDAAIRPLDELWREATRWEVGSNAETVPAARAALVARGDETLAFLVPSRLDTKDTLITRALAVVLEGIGEAAIPRLRDALAHESPDVRRNAADLLGKLGDAASAGAIAALLSDPDTRLGALQALGALKATASVPAIVAVLESPGRPRGSGRAAGPREGDGQVVRERERVSAAATLGLIGGPAAESALVAALDDHAAQVRHGAQLALERSGRAEPLLAVVSAPAGVSRRARLHAIAALGRVGDASAAGSLLPMLGDEDPIVRGFTAEALGALLRPADAAPLRPDDAAPLRPDDAAPLRPDDAAPLREALRRESDPFARGKLEEAVRRLQADIAPP